MGILTSELRKKALIQYLKITDKDDQEDIKELYDNCFETCVGEFLVLNDREADELFEDQIENYIDECILHELPEPYRYYFDNEKFIRDVRLSDGRGPTLAGYDGAEQETRLDEIEDWVFIYRVN